MSRSTAIRLVKSLSKSEKRQFKLLAKRQTGDKNYMDLFDLIDKTDSRDEEMIDKNFRQLRPGTSTDNVAAYLVKVLIDSLIRSRVKDDSLSQLLYGMLRVNLLKERNLHNEAYKELIGLQQIADNSQEHLLQYMIYRQQLNYLTEINFKDLSEKQLIGLQIKAREVLKDTRNTHEHYALYELLKYRLIRSGQILSEKDKRTLDDLLLSEMSIINAKVKNSLESQKIHLFFQSFYLTHISDFKSALKTFYDLNRLFEKNASHWHHPPLDYFSALDGILDNLRVIGRYKEMDFYIEKLNHLDMDIYPEYFQFMIRKSAISYRLALLLHTGELNAAINFIENCDSNSLKAYSLVDIDKQRELFFTIALTWFKARNLKKAHKYMNEILLIGKANHQSMIYKASMLLNIIIFYEERDLEYLDYEIRSYKRNVTGNLKLLETEKLVFKVIKLDPDFNRAGKNALSWKSLEPTLLSIEKNKYEMQIRKYFDFIKWVRDKFGK